MPHITPESKSSSGCKSTSAAPAFSLGSLELKFIVHAGTFVEQRLSTRTHVAGPAVILAHRLLKNRVTDETGLRGYALLTDAALELLGLDPSEGVDHSETFRRRRRHQRPRLRACESQTQATA